MPLPQPSGNDKNMKYYSTFRCRYESGNNHNYYIEYSVQFARSRLLKVPIHNGLSTRV